MSFVFERQLVKTARDVSATLYTSEKVLIKRNYITYYYRRYVTQTRGQCHNKCILIRAFHSDTSELRGNWSLKMQVESSL